MRAKKITSAVIWTGASLYDSATIVVIATVSSANRKTGDMVQTWILRTDVSPIAAVQSGEDVSVCGHCPLRPTLARAVSVASGDYAPRCYVEVGRAPSAVFRAYGRGGYRDATTPEARAEIGRGRMVRIGAYGDPGMVPADVWEGLLRDAAGHAGYTHQWRARPDLAAVVMASADTAADAAEAHAAGWRTYRVADAPDVGEIECPSERDVQCVDCGLCDGAGRAKSITIPDHGPGSLARKKTRA